MSRLDDWDDTIITFGSLAIIFGFVFLIVLAETIPFVAAMVLFGLGLLGLFAWGAANRFDVFADEDEKEEGATHERDSLAVLKERYARGELSEEEFEHRVTMLLDVDRIAARKQETERVTERE